MKEMTNHVIWSQFIDSILYVANYHRYSDKHNNVDGVSRLLDQYDDAISYFNDKLD
jgi:hypothetical protein